MTAKAPSVIDETSKRAPHREARRVPGKPFAIAFASFLVIATTVFAYFAAQHEQERRANRRAFMERVQQEEAGAAQGPGASPATGQGSGSGPVQ
jgi:hypothetical protein